MEILMDNYIWIIIIVVVILMTIIGYIAEKTDFGKKEFSKRKSVKKEEKKNEKIGKAEVVAAQPEASEPVPFADLPEQEPVEGQMDASATDGFVNEEPKMDDFSFESVSADAFGPVATESNDVEFTDPLADDMAVASEPMESYKAPVETTAESNVDFNIPEELSVPFGDEVAEEPMNEDLNAPFGDMEVVRPTEDLNVPLTDTGLTDSMGSMDSMTSMMEEDLNVPFGDNLDASRSVSESFNLDLPDIDSIKEDVNISSSNDSEDDDIWKF